ncbi:MAG: AMP-binding protein, partial [Humibacter sp.]
MTRERTNGVPSATIGELLTRRAVENGDSVYLEDARSDRSLTYSDALAATSSFIADATLDGRTTVFIDEADPLVFAVAHLATVAAGHRSVPLDPALTVDDIARLAGLVEGPKVLVTSSEVRAAGAGIERLAPPALQVDVVAPEARASVFRPGGSAMLFTSGSTGTPKGVELGADQLLFVGSAVAAHLGLTPDDRGYNSLPLFHINAEVVGLLSTLSAGSALVLDRRFHRTGFWPLMAERDISWINAVPAILAVLATEPIVAPP